MEDSIGERLDEDAAPPPTLLCGWCQRVMESGSDRRSYGICLPCKKLYFPEFVQSRMPPGETLLPE